MADAHLILRQCSGSVFFMCSRRASIAFLFASCFFRSRLFDRLASRALLARATGPATCVFMDALRHALKDRIVVHLLVSSSSCEIDSERSRIASASLWTPPDEDEIFGRCLRLGARSADGERWRLFLLERVRPLDLDRWELLRDRRPCLCSTL